MIDYDNEEVRWWMREIEQIVYELQSIWEEVTVESLTKGLFDRYKLSGAAKSEAATGQGTSDYLQRVYGLKATVFEIDVPEDSALVGQVLADINLENNLYIISTYYRGKISRVQRYKIL